MTQFASGYSNGYRLLLNVTETSTSIDNNTSNISWNLQCQATNSYAQWNPGPGTVSVSINGSNVWSGRPAFVFPGYNSTITLCSGSLTVGHNADGTKSIACSASYTATSSASYLPGNMSCSGNMGLSTIARATTPTLSASSVAIGCSVTINTPRASSSFTHTLRYYFMGTEGQIASNVGTSQSWTIPTSFLTSLPDSVSGQVTIYCDTYSGSTLIGTKSVALTVTVPSSYVPKISSITVSEATAGLASQFAVFVQSKSPFKVVTSASGNSGSTIKTCSVRVDGSTYTGTTVTTGVINASGDVTVSVTVTDSRGRTASTTKTVNVVAYSAPAITQSTVTRANSSGTASDEGTYALFNYAYSITNVNNRNTHTFKIQYKSGSSWVDLVTYTDYSKSGKYLSTRTFDVNSAFEFRFVVTDYFGSYTIEKSIDISFALMNFGANGHSMSIGMQSPNDSYFDLNLPSRIRQAINLMGDLTLGTLAKQAIGKFIYPVGSVISNTTGTNPGTQFGGTWEQFAQGRVLIGAGTGNDGSTSMTFTANGEGGTYTETLTIDQIPSHNHRVRLMPAANEASGYGLTQSPAFQNRPIITGDDANDQRRTLSTSTGDGKSHNNLPPHKAVYYWRRIN